jgi:hypothetical protein
MKNQFKHNNDGTTSIYYTSSKLGKTFETLIDTEDFEKVSTLKTTWFISSNGNNVKYRVKGKIDGKNVYLYRFILDANSELVVDHIDGNTLNNTKANLRVVTQKANVHNQNSQGELPRNVTYNPNSNKYRVSFKVDGKRKSFGQYHTIEEAEQVAINARRLFMPNSFV